MPCISYTHAQSSVKILLFIDGHKGITTGLSVAQCHILILIFMIVERLEKRT